MLLKDFYIYSFSKLTKEQMLESLQDFAEKHNRGFDKRPQLEALIELLK